MKKVIGKTSKAVYSSNNIIMMHIHWRQTELNSVGASKYKYIFGVGQKKRYTYIYNFWAGQENCHKYVTILD